MTKRTIIVVLFLFVLLAILATNTTVFEDGSVQFFDQVGLGLCLNPGWGCTNWVNEFLHDVMFGNLAECGIDCPYEDFYYPQPVTNLLYRVSRVRKCLSGSNHPMCS